MLSNSQRRELLQFVQSEYLDIRSAAAAVGIRYQDIPHDLLTELRDAYEVATSLLEANSLRSFVAADESDYRYLAQVVERRRQAQVRMPQSDGTQSVSQLLTRFTDDTLAVLEAVILGDEDPLADLIEARVQALVDQGVVEHRIRQRLNKPIRRTRMPTPPVPHQVMPAPAPPDNVVPIPTKSYRWPPSPHFG